MLKIFVVALGRINTQNRDGSEVRFSQVTKKWVREGHELRILLPTRELSLLQNEGVAAKYHVLSELIKSESESSLNVLTIYVLRLFQFAFYRLPDKFNIIYSPSDFLIDLIPAIFVKRRNKKAKLVVCVFLLAPNPSQDRCQVSLSPIRGRLYYLSQRFGIFLMKKFADLFLVLNELDKKALSRYDVGERVRVVNMGVDVKAVGTIKPSVQRMYDAIFVGRLTPQKGILDLIEIWNRVCQRKRGARLALVGGGSAKWIQTVVNEIKRNNLDNNVDFLGFREGREKFELLKSAKCFLMPSLYESWGMTVVEAMACALPVIAYDLPVFDSLFPYGMKKVPIGDVSAFAECVLDVLENEILRSKLAEEAQEMALKYDWDLVARQEMDLLKGLVANR